MERTLDFRLLRRLAKQSNFTNVVSFTNHTRNFPSLVDCDETPDIVCGKFLHGIIDRQVLANGVINAGVTTLVPCVGGGETFLDGDHAPTTGGGDGLGGDGTGNARG